MNVHEWVKGSRERYEERGERLASLTQRLSASDVAALVLFTPRQTYELAVRYWHWWLWTGSVEGSLPNLRAARIARVPERGLRRRPGETPAAWCARLRASVVGLGASKAPFLASLLEPRTVDVPVCIDTWMLRGLGWSGEEAAIGSEPVQRAAQRQAEMYARYHNLPRFAWQWAAWDYWRTYDPATGSVVETDIAADLAA